MGAVSKEERIKLDNAVVDLLFSHKGKANAVSGAKIAKMLREIGSADYNYDSAISTYVRRLMIERRLPICHCHQGYYWAKTKEELLESIQWLEQRVATTKETIEHLRSFLF